MSNNQGPGDQGQGWGTPEGGQWPNNQNPQWGQQPASGPGDPNAAQQPTSAGQPYGQAPNDPYGQQSAGAPYGQPSASAPYPQQSAGAPYGQPSAGAPYGQPSASAPYPQQSAGAPYGQQSASAPYGQQSASAPYGQPPAQPGYGQGGFGGGSGYGAQPGYGAPSGGGSNGAGRNKMIVLIAAVLGVALIAGIAILVFTQRDKKADPGKPPTVASPTGSAPTSPPTTEASETSASPTATSSGLGTGTYATVLAKLKSSGFLCTDEGAEGIKSTICTHYDSSPIMLAYVAGNDDGHLGRVALDVQSTNRPSVSRALSDFLITAFAGSEGSEVKTMIASGTNENYAEGEGEGFYYRGDKDGSVVLALNHWPSSSAKPRLVDAPVASIKAFTAQQKYTCSATGPLIWICTRTEGGIKVSLRYTQLDDATTDKVLGLDLVVTGPDKAKVAALFNAEQAKMMALAGAQGTELMKVIKNSPSNGLTRFVSGVLVDYYPTYGASGTQRASQYLRPPCWKDVLSFC